MQISSSNNKSLYPISSLGYYVKSIVFEQFKKDRKPLEDKWQRNLDAFNSESGEVWKAGEGEDWRSTTTTQAVRIKTIMAWSIVVDMYLQGGEIPFELIPSPWDYVTLEDMEKEERAETEKAIEDMTSLIKQQFVDCHADRQFMKNLMSSALYGETIAKKTVYKCVRKGFKFVDYSPEGSQQVANDNDIPMRGLQQDQPMSMGQQQAGMVQPQQPQAQQQYHRYEPYRDEFNAPGWDYLSNWGFYRDISTDDLQKGLACIEYGMVSPYELRKLKGTSQFIFDDKIDDVIKIAAEPGFQSIPTDQTGLPPGLRDQKHRYNTIERIEYWGRVPRKVLEEFERELKRSKKGKENKSNIQYPDYVSDGDEQEVLLTMADNEIIRLVRLKEGERPFCRAIWEFTLDDISGRGVPDNIEKMQTLLNGIIRAFEDNKKLSGNVILATLKRLIPDWDGIIKPGMNLDISEEAKDIRTAIQSVVIPDVGESLLSAVGLIERYLDEASMLPKIMLGSVLEKHKPDTLGETQMLQSNAGKYYGGVIKNHDEGIIEPMAMSFFEYNMRDPKVTKGKGNFIAVPTGFSTFHNKIVRLDKILKYLNIIMQSPKLMEDVKFPPIHREIAKALDISPDTVIKSLEEKQQETQELMKQQEEMLMQQQGMKMKELEMKLLAEIEKLKVQHMSEVGKENLKHEHGLEKMGAEAFVEKGRAGGPKVQ